ncbi:MAG: hypothetical protein E7654_06750 [Ruminococcaceae bacterium]|nr:hypothetical protein [Oscillospiraceae bacterium]
MPNSLVGMFAAFLIGAALSYVNYLLTAKAAKASSGQLAGVSLLRQLINIGYLALVFFLAPYTPWDRIWMLVGAVLGVTLPMFLFTFLLLRRLKQQTGGRDGEDTKGGEN